MAGNKASRGSLIAGLAGAGGFLATYFLVLPDAFFPAVLAGGAIFAGTLLAFNRSPEDAERESLRAARASLDELRRNLAPLPKGPAREAALRLHREASALLEDARSNEETRVETLVFLASHLPSAARLVARHAALANESTVSGEVGEATKRSAELIDRLAEAFSRRRGELRDDELAGLEAEIELLDEGLKAEGEGR